MPCVRSYQICFSFVRGDSGCALTPWLLSRSLRRLHRLHRVLDPEPANISSATPDVSYTIARSKQRNRRLRFSEALKGIRTMKTIMKRNGIQISSHSVSIMVSFLSWCGADDQQLTARHLGNMCVHLSFEQTSVSERFNLTLTGR